MKRRTPFFQQTKKNNKKDAPQTSNPWFPAKTGALPPYTQPLHFPLSRQYLCQRLEIQQNAGEKKKWQGSLVGTEITLMSYRMRCSAFLTTEPLRQGVTLFSQAFLQLLKYDENIMIQILIFLQVYEFQAFYTLIIKVSCF